ncbi:MAG: tetratricopeptide repeat protein [Bacteroidales bacterium]|nr:tetratricopeptide repeat protein [Bacteroidales bacterium]
MKKTASILLFFALFIFNFNLISAQQNPVDSLKTVLETTQIDTVKVNTLCELANMMRGRDNEQAKNYAEQALTLSLKIDYKKGTADVYKTLGIIHFMFGDVENAYKASYNSRDTYEIIGDKKGIAACYVNIGIFNRNTGKIKESEESYRKALEIYEEIKDKEGIAKTNLNLGNNFRQQGNFKSALEFYLRSLKFFEEIDDKNNTAQLYQNIGIVYDEQNESEKAIENFNKALQIFNDIENIKGIADVNNNLGNFYAEKKEFDLSNDYYLKALKLFEEMGYFPMIARLYYNLGDINNKKKEYNSAKEYFDKSVEIYESMNHAPGLALCYNGLGEYYYYQSNYEKAIEYLLKAKEISEKTDINTSIEAVEWLSLNYAKTGDYKKAYENHVLFKALNDSIFNENNEKEITELRMQYDFEQEEKIRKEKERIEKEKNEAIQKEKDKKDFVVKLGLSLLVLFMLLIAVISIFSYRRKVKANKLLEAQKQEIESQKVELEQSNEEIMAQRDEIEEKNILITEQRDIALKQKQEITDSIQYAQRIQDAILPDKKMFVQDIEDYFIYFKPKDIVSGDFYWMTLFDDKLIVTAADCTGHGVPGAFMSMLGITFLNEIVNKDRISEAGKILDKLRAKIIDSLHQTDGESKDGMDMAISVIDTKKQEIQYAGAYNPLYIISADENNVYNIKKISADRMPIGIHLKMDDDFTNHVIKYNKGDSVYMFSDGYMDQFGGENGRKLKSRKFQELLLTIQDKTMAEQKDILDKFLNKWKGDLEQLDDIIIIGMKL